MYAVVYSDLARRIALSTGRCFLATMGLLVCMIVPAAAQPGRGERGPGDRGGDFRARFLQRMDANGNGMLEPNEIPDRGRRFLERMTRDAGLDLSQPIPIDRFLGNPPGGPPPEMRGGPPDEPANRNGPPENTNTNEAAKEDQYPIVPRFGDASVRPFGVSPTLLAGKTINLEKKYDRRILENLERIMQRHDKNHNGILEHAEWSGVPWQGDPRESNLDKDFQLTKAEMAERLAKADAEGGASGEGERNSPWGMFRGRRGEGRDGGRERGSRGPGGFPFDPAQFMERMARGPEGSAAPVDPGSAATSTEGSPQANTPNPMESRVVEGSEQLKGRKSYRISPRLLPKLLPAWWESTDANRDGQVTLSEYLAADTNNTARSFRAFDANRDGIVTAREAETREKSRSEK